MGIIYLDFFRNTFAFLTESFWISDWKFLDFFLILFSWKTSLVPGLQRRPLFINKKWSFSKRVAKLKEIRTWGRLVWQSCQLVSNSRANGPLPLPKSPSLICRAVKIWNCSTGASSAQWESRTILGTASCAVSVPSPGFLQRFFTKRFTTALVVGPGLDTGCDDPARAVSLYQHTISLQGNHMMP